MLKSVKADPWGRVLIDASDAVEVLFAGEQLTAFDLQDCPEFTRYNEQCRLFDKAEYQVKVAAQPEIDAKTYHEQRSRVWLTEVEENGLWDKLLTKCRDDRERARFVLELEEFHKRGMLPVLLQLNHMIEQFDQQKIVRGVGRGSSVASFILYLMGVHFINPLDYDLDLAEFLKD